MSASYPYSAPMAHAVLHPRPSTMPTRHQNGTSFGQHQRIAAQVARLAVRSLYAELALYPKPGLVSLRDNGSHTDMTAETFLRSLFSLRHYFREMALAGMAGADFQTLKQGGIRAEQRMLRATKGINTHRGAIFCLGLLCAALSACLGQMSQTPTISAQHISADQVRATLLGMWGEELVAHSAVALQDATAAPEHALSHGLQVAQQYAISGAREEAARAYPSVFALALPHLSQRIAAGASTTAAQIDTLFLLMAHMHDTNVYYRGGAAAATFTRQTAQDFLSAGGTLQHDWFARAEACHHAFVQQRLSPGGAADLFAATWMMHLAQSTSFSVCHA